MSARDTRAQQREDRRASRVRRQSGIFAISRPATNTNPPATTAAPAPAPAASTAPAPAATSTPRTPPPGMTPASLEYVLKDVWGVAMDSTIAKGLAHAGITTFVGLINTSTVEFDALVYPKAQLPDANGDAQPDLDRPVPSDLIQIAKGFLGYVYYRDKILKQPLTACQPIIPSPVQQPKSKTRTPAEEFDKNIKLDPSAFPILKHDKDFDPYHRGLLATARSQHPDLLKVFDPTYVPQTQEEHDLFERLQAYMYKVFNSTLLSNKGQELVRKYEKAFDAQAIHDELEEYQRESEKAKGGKSELLLFIMQNKLTDDTWRGLHDDYITHWIDKVRQYNELETVAPLGEEMKFLFLSNAISLQPHLAAVKSSYDTIQATNSNSVMTFLSYTEMLHSAAQQYDRVHTQARRRTGNRCAYSHELDFTPADFTCDFDSFNEPFSIDTSLDDIASYQAYRSASNSSGFHPRPRLPNKRWQQLSDTDRRPWAQIPTKTKAIFLKDPHIFRRVLDTTSTAPPDPTRQANLHALPDSSGSKRMGRIEEGTPGTEQESGKTDNILLAHATSQKEMPPPGQLQCLMSDKLAKTQAINRTQANGKSNGITKVKKHEVLMDDAGNIYKVNKVNVIYSVKNSNSTRSGFTLVDRGANGGLSGSDVCTITKTDRFVDVRGIDQHQVTDKPIVTSCGYTESQHGPIVVILNQQADMGSGQTILSSGQMEAFGIKVDDKSYKAGGKQCITTPDGFVIPIRFHNGLPHIKMRPPTDRELSNPDIPHVVLTSDADWDPTILDNPDFDLEEWRRSIPDYDSDEGE